MPRCDICPHYCELNDGDTGRCHARKAEGDTTVPLGLHWASSLCYDPLEKKNIYHYYPGRYVVAAGAWGCSFGCSYCQNSRISQRGLQIERSRRTPTEDLLSFAKQRDNVIGVHFGYSEPLVIPEWIEQSAPAIREEGYKVLVGTNGFTTDAVLDRLLPLVDSWSLSFRGFDHASVSEVAQVDGTQAVEAALHTLDRVFASGAHVEVAYVVIPGVTDTPPQMDWFFQTIHHLSPRIPVHLLAHIPHYQYRWGIPTERSLLEMRKLGETVGLRYVYVENIPNLATHGTWCRSCHKPIITRDDLKLRTRYDIDGCCPDCGDPLDITE